jgi:hypothetical protein
MTMETSFVIMYVLGVAIGLLGLHSGITNDDLLTILIGGFVIIISLMGLLREVYMYV